MFDRNISDKFCLGIFTHEMLTLNIQIKVNFELFWASLLTERNVCVFDKR